MLRLIPNGIGRTVQAVEPLRTHLSGAVGGVGTRELARGFVRRAEGRGSTARRYNRSLKGHVMVMGKCLGVGGKPTLR